VAGSYFNVQNQNQIGEDKMAWQTNTEAGRILYLGYAAEDAAKPTIIPALGASLDWTATASGENMNGWTVNDFDLTEDDFEITADEGAPIIVRPPIKSKKVGILRDSALTPDEISFSTYEIGQKVLQWATNQTNSAGVYSFSGTYTRRAFILEVPGIGFHYMPSVEIVVGPSGGGVKSLGTHAITLQIFGTASLEDGYQWQQYESAE
jgi:hypothetical protein